MCIKVVEAASFVDNWNLWIQLVLMHFNHIKLIISFKNFDEGGWILFLIYI